MFFYAPNAPKIVFGRVSAPDLAAGTYDAPPDSLIGGGEANSPNTLTSVDAVGVSISVRQAPINSWQRLCV